jgi:hypothetical protein
MIVLGSWRRLREKKRKTCRVWWAEKCMLKVSPHISPLKQTHAVADTRTSLHCTTTNFVLRETNCFQHRATSVLLWYNVHMEGRKTRNQDQGNRKRKI